jgi:nucleoside-diphosphate-sugar epimerase
MNSQFATICVIGGGGYVGSTLVPSLVTEGYNVKVLDTFWYGKDVFDNLKGVKNLSVIQGDVRDNAVVKSALNGCDAVIHLACISNDPSFDMNPQLGKSVNLDCFEPLVKVAKAEGVKRFVFASSSSVYGIKEEKKVTESLSLEPLTDYSKYKAICENILLSNMTSDFVCTVVRPATVCGYSVRQRFDLAVNILTNHAINRGEIKVFGGGQYRPNLHIQDMVDAYLHILEEDSEKIAGEVFNIGSKNLTLDSIAKIVSEITGVTNIKYESTDDLRSYRVDSSHIAEKIGFVPKREVDDAVSDLVKAFTENKFFNPLDNPLYFNIKRMKELNLA